MTAEQRHWYNLGRRVKMAESAGREAEVTRLVAQSDRMIDNTQNAPVKRGRLVDAYIRGRWS